MHANSSDTQPDKCAHCGTPKNFKSLLQNTQDMIVNQQEEIKELQSRETAHKTTIQTLTAKIQDLESLLQAIK